MERKMIPWLDLREQIILNSNELPALRSAQGKIVYPYFSLPPTTICELLEVKGFALYLRIVTE